MIVNNIVNTIGNTPVVLVTDPYFNSSKIYLKLETFNPTFSIKDRAAKALIEYAENNRLLNKETTIIESTSGNLGRALAIIAAVKGYKLVLVVDPKVPTATVNFYKAIGVTIVYVNIPDEVGSYQKARIQKVKELQHEIPNSYWPNQYDNPANPQGYKETLAQEILADFNTLDYLVAAVSTGGHLSGIAQGIKNRYENLSVVAVDAQGSSIFGAPSSQYLLNGIGLSWTPGNLQHNLIDSVTMISDQQAFSACRLLLKDKGIFVGGSGGAVFCACLKLSRLATDEKTILGIIPDSGINYLDSIYNEDWLQENKVNLFENYDALIDSFI
jgi:2,3-diaminopropionate biosynthesis protein SbnA